MAQSDQNQVSLQEIASEVSKHEDWLPVLKWLKAFLMEKKFHSEEAMHDLGDISLTTANEQQKEIMKQPYFKKFLIDWLDFLPPDEENDHWTIPSYISDFKEMRKEAFYNTHILICLQKNSCKGCEKPFKNILLHISKSNGCRGHYAKEDIKELHDNAKFTSKANARIWQENNKDRLSKKKALRYQEKKLKIQQDYLDNQEQIRQKRAEYYDKNRRKISHRRKWKRQQEKAKLQPSNQNEDDDTNDDSDDNESEDSESEFKRTDEGFGDYSFL